MTAQPELRPLGPALGTEVLGIDLADIDDEGFAEVRRAFAEHPVLVFREQSLGAAELAAFGSRFGRPRPHSLINYRYPGHPEVSYLRNVDDAGKIDWFGVKRATAWHTDSTYETELPLLAILHALEVPSQRGGTVFADMYAAYETLPQAMKDRLAALTCLHGHTSGPAGGTLYRNNEAAKTADREYEEKPWPAITRHPVTDKPILFVNPMHVHGIVGMEKDEAWDLIEELARHATQEQFTYYHNWRVGDVVMWDERATMHRGAGDYEPSERRVMLRTIVYPTDGVTTAH
jgi:alpha-ketoglutarate-dependent taurine dioxygenase